MDRSKLTVKGILVVIIWAAYFILKEMLYPVLTNVQALRQLEDNSGSFTNLAAYQQLWQFAWMIPAVLCIVICLKELKIIFYKFRGGF